VALSGPYVVLVRHAETEWTLSGQHTGTTDIALTEAGREAAVVLGRRLRAWSFQTVLSSPLARALETCRLAGVAESPQQRDELVEWDYGDYEGLTTPQIRERREGWNLWRDGAPAGETAQDVGRRADRVIAELVGHERDSAVFAHGHILRVLAARWLGLGPEYGALLALSPGSISVLGHEREQRVLRLWNDEAAATGD